MSYQIDDLCKIFKRDRSTIWRWRKKNIISQPDIEIGANPVWLNLPILRNQPNPPTNPST